ncbi:hypothetical protein Calhy_0405 [Caldicellulosiruptor hydrothermalis 108]|uniref:DUF2325 domain-containing protein n=1 Tax=Caldicellulosiruptor hydrothermalis (strain DSM 18901 / VKM B-2411 / 108) TaxID=632292 RepID=E4QBX9_CALH1|nr:hypothetical protein [Caldicellulosiruptor hydrothermalis]ADQ06153.1 hypothetical protein Calhy_0405 [Caldicellulosiruptor hydrothermalis 108]
MEKKLDLYPYVAAAISINPKAWHIIDNKILKHLDKLYEYGIKSDYWNKPPIVSLPADSVIYARELLCAFEYIKNNNEDNLKNDEILDDIFEMLRDIFKKAFPEVYQRVVSATNISIDRVLRSLVLAQKERKDYAWEELIWYEKNMFLTVFCAKLFGKEIIIDDGYKFFSEYLRTRLEFDDKNECVSNLDMLGHFKKMDIATFEEYKKEGRRLQKTIETNNPYFFRMYFIRDEFNAETQQAKNVPPIDSYLQKLNAVPAQDIINAVYPKLNSVLAYMFDIFDVDVPELQYANLDHKDIEHIYSFAYMCQPLFNNMSEKEKLSKLQDIIVISVYLWPLLKDYVKLKQQYATLHSEYVTKFVIQKKEQEDIESLQEEIKKLKLLEARYNGLKKQYSNYDVIKNQLEFYKSNYEKLLTENEQLKKENSQLVQELEKYKADIEELAKLRSIVFEEEIETPQPAVNDYSVLKDKKIAIIGGHKGQFDELKNYVQELLHIEVGRLNYDENILATVDVVVFISKILNHTGYYKAINAVKKLKLKYVITSYINTEKILKLLTGLLEE